MEQLRIKKERNKKGFLLVIIGILLILIGSSVLIYRYYDNKETKQIEDNSVEIFFEEEIHDEEIKQEEPKEEKPQVIINYVAILEIPKINLKRGLVDKNSYLNNVDRNIYTLKETTYPNDESVSHILLASHSGNSSVSFFRNLKRLDNNDLIYLYYNNVKYTYEVYKHYEIEKTGTMKMDLSSEDDITLITCKSNTNKQFVYKAILTDKENY